MSYKTIEQFLKKTFRTWEELHDHAEQSGFDMDGDYEEFTEAAHDAAGHEGPLEDLLHDYNNLLEFTVDRTLTTKKRKGE